jgi:hypothetical protein
MTTTALQHIPNTFSGVKQMALEYYDKWQRLDSKMERAGAANEKRLDVVVDGAIVVGGAAAMAYANGKRMQQTGQVYQLGGHDADMLAGSVLTGAAVFFPKILGKYTEKGALLGAGILASSVTRIMFAKGQAAALPPGAVANAMGRQAVAPAAATAGRVPASGMAGAGG